MALKRIVLRDFVIVKELDLDLEKGFTALTGETGAGKSILIDAVQLAMGARGDSGVVREGATRADISIELDHFAQLDAILDEGGFDPGEHILLRRTLDLQGKSRAWINGGPATMGQLRALGERLIDIHGQHAWQSLTRPDSAQALLDAYAAIDTSALQTAWRLWRDAHKALVHARQIQETTQREQERLAWQISEVEKLAPGDQEWTELNHQHSRLANAQTLLDASQQAVGILEQDDLGAQKLVSNAVQILQANAHMEPQFESIIEVLASSLAQLEDATHSLHAYLRTYGDADTATLSSLDARLALWISLARRFHRPPEDLHKLLETWKKELLSTQAAMDIEQLSHVEKERANIYRQHSLKISEQRRKAAPALANAISSSMQQLGMAGGKFDVSIASDEPSATGVDRVEFLVAGHAGVTPRPISKVASGGELSRIALAIAVTTSQLGSAQTLIFDEVDTGVGGAVAETVGRLLQQLGLERQVLAVTHLPQVAACANHQLVVSKQSSAHGVESSVYAVAGVHRTNEIARMLGGEKLSETTLAHAKEMLSTSTPTQETR